MDLGLEWQKAQRGELYRAFVPELIAARNRCIRATDAFNQTKDTSRRNMVKLWREITGDTRPLPPPAASQEEDDQLFENDPWVCAPLRADYGINIKMAPGSMVNWNSTWVDTCPINIGARTIIGPNCSFYSGTHPLDPAVRNGLAGPESGKPINIGNDCWLGGNVIILPGITIGNGSTVGAGSVVTKDVPAFHVAAGNPAKVLRKVQTSLGNPISGEGASNNDRLQGAEVPMAQE